MDSLQAHKGEPFQYWRLRTTASFGAIPLELLPQYLDAHPELT